MQLLSKRWLLKHLLALALVLLLIRLGFWQLRRLEEKRAHNAATLAALEQPGVTLTGDPVDPAALHFRRVRATGTYDHAASIVWRNQQFNGIDGVHLLTPLRIAGSDTAVLIDRGWLPQSQAQPAAWDDYALPDETVTVAGIARRTQPRPDSPLAPADLPLPDATRIDAWLRVDIAQIQTQVPYPLLPIFIQQTPLPGTDATTLPQPVEPGTLDEGPHLGYALQWFTFAGILALIYVLLLHQELKPTENVSDE
ncbi:MAG: SURF1 family protein [Chloroflexaceae bacterium]